jgi:hypothetical protein
MKITISADDLFMLPQAVPATSADLWENEANEIVKKGHIGLGFKAVRL